MWTASRPFSVLPCIFLPDRIMLSCPASALPDQFCLTAPFESVCGSERCFYRVQCLRACISLSEGLHSAHNEFVTGFYFFNPHNHLSRIISLYSRYPGVGFLKNKYKNNSQQDPLFCLHGCPEDDTIFLSRRRTSSDVHFRLMRQYRAVDF